MSVVVLWSEAADAAVIMTAATAFEEDPISRVPPPHSWPWP